MANVPPQGSSNYYRPGPPRANPMQPSGRISFDAISVAWRMISSDWGTWVPISLITLAIMYALSIPASVLSNVIAYGNPFPGFSAWGPRSGTFQTFPTHSFIIAEVLSVGFNLLLQGIEFVFFAGIMNIAVLRMEGRPASIGDMFVGFRRVAELLTAGIVYALLSFIGAVFCILPGLLVMSTLSLAPLLVLRQGLNGLDALKKSFEITRNNMWLMLGTWFCAYLLTLVGACACGVGLLFTFPILYATIAVIYYNLFGPQGEGPVQETAPQAG